MKHTKKKIIAFSEINKDREGANSEITETFKQLAEGGVDILKKDVMTGYKTTKHIKGSQKTLLYGTTETATDQELETRYVVIPIKGYRNKNKTVVNDALRKARDINYYINKKKKESWIEQGINSLDKDLQVIIPFTEVFEEKIEDEDGEKKYLFDYNKERIKRDAKRLLSLTRAIAWLYQKQRVKIEHDGQKFIAAEPTDFITALEIFSEFFNLTYSGLDHRVQKTLDIIKEESGKHSAEITNAGFGMDYSDFVPRNIIQDRLSVTRNTIKDYIEVLHNHRKIETKYDPSVTNKMYLVAPINSPINNLSLPISVKVIDRCLTGWLTGTKWYEKQGKQDLSPIEKPDLLTTNQENKLQRGSDKLTGEKLTGEKTPESTVLNHSFSEYWNKMKTKLEAQGQVEVEDLVKIFGEDYRDEVDKVIEKKKREGDVFEVKPGVVKLT